ncbi:MAG: hypothetical protein KAT40_05565, partial [Bacteroidales bacterium]|nr:hypothetical protein [Bacteroidales bacterium]
MTSKSTIPKHFITFLAVISFTALTAFNLYGQPTLIPVDAPNNQYPITFTDANQKVIILEFDEAITTCGTTAGWTIKVNGIGVTIAVGPQCVGTYIRFTLQNTISYNDRNSVTVTYDSGPGTVAGAGGDAPSFTDVSAVNNYIAIAADFANGLYGEVGDVDRCAPVEDAEIEYNMSLTQRYRNSIHYANPKAYIRWEAPNDNPKDQPFMNEVAPVGSGVYTVTSPAHDYPDNTDNCTWRCTVFPYIYNSGTLQPNIFVTVLTVDIIFPNYKLDNGTPAPGTGSLNIDPPINQSSTLFCVGEDIVDFQFDDDVTFDCRVDVEADRPNEYERNVQFVYGTHSGDGIPNVYIDVYGTDVQVTDNDGNVILGPFTIDADGNAVAPYWTTFGFEGPVETYDPATTPPFPDLTTYPISHTGDFVNDTVDDVFEVTLRNWGPCNLYDGADPFTYLDAVTTTSRLRLLLSPETPNVPPTVYCLNDPISITASSGGGTGGTFKWYSDAALTDLEHEGNPFDPTLDPNPPDRIDNTVAGSKTYYVTETLGSGCEGPDSAFTVIVREELTLSDAITGPAEACENEAGLTFSLPSDPPVQPFGGTTEYNWTVPGDWTINSGQGTKEINVDVASSGNKTVSVVLRYTTVPNCPTAPVNHNITIHPTTVAGSVTGGSTPICEGSNTGVMTLGGYTGSINKWQKQVDGLGWNDIVHTNATYSEIPSSAGTWEYRAEVQSGTCAAIFSAENTIVVDPATVAGSVT